MHEFLIQPWAKYTPYRPSSSVWALYFLACVIIGFVMGFNLSIFRHYNEKHSRQFHKNLSMYGISVRDQSEILEAPKINMNMSHLDMDYRRNFVRKRCEQLQPNFTELQIDPWYFVKNDKYRLIWCNVFKAGWTSWMYNFKLLNGYSPEFLRYNHSFQSYYERHHNISEIEFELQNYTSFVIVRHPFERILSMYLDEIRSPEKGSYYEKISAEIIEKYRLNKSDTSTRPKFEEYIRYVIDANVTDRKIASVVESCTPCLVNYTVIIDFEHLWEDQEYLINFAHLEDKIRQQNRNKRPGPEIKSLIPIFFKELNSTHIYKLKEKYKYDFAMFKFSLDAYLKWTKDAVKENPVKSKFILYP